MTISPNQQRAIDRAPPKQKAALRRTYERQNALDKQRNAPKPKARAKQAPARRQGGNGGGTKLVSQPKSGRCLNFMDPLCPLPTPSIVASGRSLPHSAMVTDVFTLAKTEQAMLIATQYGGTSTVGYFGKYTTTGQLISSSEKTYDLPTLDLSASGGGPTSTRAMRLSCSVVNTTNMMNRGGSVQYMNSSQRLGEIVAPGVFGTLLDTIRDSPYRKVVNGDQLQGGPRTPNRMIAYPTDSPKYHEFNAHVGMSTKPEFLRRCLVRYTAGSGLLDDLPRCMSIIVWIFDPPPEEQTYRLTIRGSMYTRWPLSSVPGHHMSPTPTVEASVFNKVVEKLESSSSALFAEGGVAGILAPKVAEGAQYFGRAALSGARDLVAGGFGMGEFGALSGASGGLAAIELM